MKLILTMVALLTLVARETAAGQTAGYAVGGIGTTSLGSGYNVHVNWTYPGNQTSKGGVILTESKDGRVVYRVQTDKNTLPTMISVSPDLGTLQVAVWAYVKGFTVKYSSLGSCGPVLTAEKTSIVVTLTDTSVKVECPSKSYTFSSEVKASNPITFRRVK